MKFYSRGGRGREWPKINSVGAWDASRALHQTHLHVSQIRKHCLEIQFTSFWHKRRHTYNFQVKFYLTLEKMLILWYLVRCLDVHESCLLSLVLTFKAYETITQLLPKWYTFLYTGFLYILLNNLVLRNK